jgi:uncharacterized protein YkwD
MKKLVALISIAACLIAGACAAGRTKVSPRDRAEQNQQVYEIYRQYMEATNVERQQAGLPPLTIRSYEEFRRAPGTD